MKNPKKERKATPRRASLSDRMRAEGLNFRNEIILMVAVDLCIIASGVALCIQQRSFYSLLAFASITVIFDYFFLGRYQRIKKAREARLESEFVDVFTYFSIHIKNGLPVYASLKESIKYASPELGARLRKLVDDIDGDKGLSPYVRFASSFDSIAINEVMVSIYRMVEEGGGELYLRQFDYLFRSLADEKRRSDLERRRKGLGDLTFIPVIASGFTMIVLTYGIVGVVGGMASNGI